MDALNGGRHRGISALITLNSGNLLLVRTLHRKKRSELRKEIMGIATKGVRIRNSPKGTTSPGGEEGKGGVF